MGSLFVAASSESSAGSAVLGWLILIGIGFAIWWPGEPRVISPRDAAIPDFDPGQYLAA